MLFIDMSESVKENAHSSLPFAYDPVLHPTPEKGFPPKEQSDVYLLLLRPEFMLLPQPPLLTES